MVASITDVVFKCYTVIHCQNLFSEQSETIVCQKGFWLLRET